MNLQGNDLYKAITLQIWPTKSSAGQALAWAARSMKQRVNHTFTAACLTDFPGAK